MPESISDSLSQHIPMENVIYNELRMRGYSVDVGVIPIAQNEIRMARLSENNWKLILCAILVLPDIIFSRHIHSLMK